jgi:hypothetical protein
MKHSLVSKKGDQFEVVRTETVSMSHDALIEHRTNLQAALAQAQEQIKHLQEWQEAVLQEVRQIDDMLAGK